MDRKEKFLEKVPREDKLRILLAVDLILAGKLETLDVKKLKGSFNDFRVRVGKYRILYKTTDSGNLVYKVNRRSDHTY